MRKQIIHKEIVKVIFIAVWVRCSICGNKTRLQIRSDTQKRRTDYQSTNQGLMKGRRPWYGRSTSMNVSMELKNGLIWTSIVSPKFKRLQYYFEIVQNDEKQNLFEDGLYTDDEMEQEGIMKQYFKYAWMKAI